MRRARQTLLLLLTVLLLAACSGQATAGRPLTLRWLFANAHGGAGVRAAGSLPSAPKESRSAYTLSSQLGASQVQALARLFGLGEEAHEQDGIWTVENASSWVEVDAAAGHSWDMRGPMTAGGSGSGGGCGAANGDYSSVDAMAAARRLLDRILSTTGQSADHVTVTRTDCGAVGTAEQHVDGLRTVDYSTHLDITDDGTPVTAYGWFGRPTPAGHYALQGAERALARVALPGKTAPAYCLRSTRKPYCHGTARQIKHVQLGLMMVRRTDDSQALVPAWLFQLDGQSDLLAVVAVATGEVRTRSPSPTS